MPLAKIVDDMERMRRHYVEAHQKTLVKLNALRADICALRLGCGAAATEVYLLTPADVIGVRALLEEADPHPALLDAFDHMMAKKGI